MSTGKNFWNGFSPKGIGPGILGPFKEAGHSFRKAVIVRAGLVTKNAGQSSRYGIDDRHGSDFASAEHEVANTELICNQLSPNPFVDTFISSTYKCQTPLPAELSGNLLIESAALRCQEDYRDGPA